jgi:hypothetical protein
VRQGCGVTGMEDVKVAGWQADANMKRLLGVLK